MNQAQATLTYWDPTGATASSTPTGTWENAAWSTSSALTATPVSWVAATAADFSAGTSATGAFTVTINNAENVAGIFNGLGGSVGGTVTISGPGSLSVPSGQQGFYTASPGSTIVDVPITGSGAQVVLEDNGQFYLDATNTYTGGTQLGFATSGTAAFTGILNFNNGSAFGSGAITMYSSGCALVLQGTAAVTVPNSMTAAAVSLNIVGNPAGLTFSGPWNMAATPNIGSGVAGNLVIISGVMSGAGGLNKYNPGILQLNAANTYTGATTVSNGTLALGSSGSINNTVSLSIFPGANGSVFDVSAIHAFTLGGSTTLVGMGTGTAATTASTIKGASGGTVSLGSRPVILNFVPTGFSGDTTHPPLYISQGALTLNNNTFTVTNAAATALGIGTYRIIQVGNGASGTVNGTPNATVSVKGSGIVSNTVVALAVTNGDVNLVVKPDSSFTNFSISVSNTIGVGATSVTISGKVGTGSVYPSPGESIGANFNGSLVTNLTVSDSSGDFSCTFAPSAVAYSSNPYTNKFTYNGDGALGPATNGTFIVPPNGFYTNDSLPGFISGLNLFFTNKAGIPMYTWSTTNTGLPVPYWNVEGQMQEQPLNDGSGNSRYSINVTPAEPLVYYISGPSSNWPYLNPAGVNWIATDTNGNYTYFSSNTVPISITGVLDLPSAPVVIQQPTNLTVLAGQNAAFNAVVTGSQPLNYQWSFNTNTPVGTNAVLSLTGVSTNQIGTYMLSASNQYGSAATLAATLNVLPPPQISTQLSSNGLQVSGTAAPNGAYSIQTTSNLMPPAVWTTVASGNADSNGFIQFTDPSVFTNFALFYRFAFP